MPLKFRMQLIADERYESAYAFDVNNDGTLDIVSGAYWYEGPDFVKKHPIGEVKVVRRILRRFLHDPDGHQRRRPAWISSPAAGGAIRCAGARTRGDPAKPWPEHVIAETGNIETTRAWDVDGDGQPEIVPNTPAGRWSSTN